MWDDHVKVSSIDIPRYLIISTRLRAISFKFKLKLVLADLWGYLLTIIKFVLGLFNDNLFWRRHAFIFFS